jgi:hypothetical protein
MAKLPHLPPPSPELLLLLLLHRDPEAEAPVSALPWLNK